MSRDPATLLDLLHACEMVLQFKGNITKERFLANEEKQSAIIHQLMIIGEATKRLSREYRDSHSQIFWTNIAGMRDRLIHGYDEVDLNLVWAAVKRMCRLCSNF